MKSPLGRFDYSLAPHYQDKLADLIRAEKPNIVVETGVWEGLSTEFILKALDDNGRGKLYSIDPMDPNHITNGAAGPRPDYDGNPIVHPRFTLIRQKSTESMTDLFWETGPWDFFLHDSDHSEFCQTAEYEMAWQYVRSGGIIASDDIFWGSPPHMAWSKFLIRHDVPLNAVYVMGNAQWMRKPL